MYKEIIVGSAGLMSLQMNYAGRIFSHSILPM